jgi:hypothetical protein
MHQTIHPAPPYFTRTLLRRGDLVEILSPDEIAATLDDHGTLDELPFMPEMLAYCGRRYRVAYHVEKTCVDGYHETFRTFGQGDVVFLEDLRCDGAAHDGCARSCRLFWKTAWLRRVDSAEIPPETGSEAAGEILRHTLRTRRESGRYVCQSTSLIAATQPLPRMQRLLKLAEDVQRGNRTLAGLAAQLALAVSAKLRGWLFGKWPSGTLDKTPTMALGLLPGDRVVVRSKEEIRATLDAAGKNRGLRFTAEMEVFCGQEFVVQNILDRMILEHTGEMLDVRNTVILDQVTCRCTFAIGGCHRAENAYWREIWLRRVE